MTVAPVALQRDVALVNHNLAAANILDSFGHVNVRHDHAPAMLPFCVSGAALVFAGVE